MAEAGQPDGWYSLEDMMTRRLLMLAAAGAVVAAGAAAGCAGALGELHADATMAITANRLCHADTD